jgi:DNA-binding transcriptional MerR regulator
MTRSQAAESCGLRPETLRYYERIGLVPHPARTANEYRDYADPDLKRFAFIRKARDLGFSIAEIRGILDVLTRPSGFIEDGVTLVKRKIEHLGKRIEEARALRDSLILVEKSLRRGTYCSRLESLVGPLPGPECSE